MGIAWQCVALRHHTRRFAKDLMLSVWQMQVDYILGKKVWRLRASDEDGLEAVGPSWKSILKYEFEMRKHALELVNYEGYSLAGALAASRAYSEVMSLHFVTPLAIRGKQNTQGKGVKRDRTPEDPHRHTHPQHTSQGCKG